MTTSPQPLRPMGSPVQLLTLDGYLNYQFPATHDIIGHSILPERGRLLVLALKGVGKTVILTQLCGEIASQEMALGLYDIQDRGKCIIFQKEIPDEHFQIRMSQVSQKYRIDPRYLLIPLQGDFADVMFLDTPGGQLLLENTIAWERPKVVGLDPWYLFHNQDDNDNFRIKPILLFLDRIRRAYDVAFILSHHLRKPSTDYRGRKIPQTMYENLGASALVNWADTVFTMNEQTKEKVHCQTFMRHSQQEAPELILTRNRRYATFDAQEQGDPTGAAELEAAIIIQKNGQMKWRDLVYEVQKKKIGPKQAEKAVIRLAAKHLVYVKGSNSSRVVINLDPGARIWYR